MIRTRIDNGCEVPTYLCIENRILHVDNGNQYRGTKLTSYELQWIVAFARKAGIFPSSDSCQAPAWSEGVKAEAKRSPEGRLDAEANAGHCAPMVTEAAGRDMYGARTPAQCAWNYIPHCSQFRGVTCA